MTALRALGFFLVLALPLDAAAVEPVSHVIQAQLFEVIEDGALSNKRISLDVFAVKNGGISRARCHFVVITINNEAKHLYLDMFTASTDDSSIRDLRIDKDGLSFEMTPFPLAPDRPIRIVAARGGGPGGYKLSAVGAWTGLIDKSKLVKTEWRQVPSVTLPYSIIRR